MILSVNLVVTAAILYVILLFIVAFLGDKQAEKKGGGFLKSPIIYTLSISVYCTSWTFYGAVGSAARSGLEFVTIYLGPTFVFIAWWFLLRKLVRIGRVHRITSIADLLSSRYGKSTSLAALVTLIAVIGTTPYIALQLKAVTASFQVVSNAAAAGMADDASEILLVRTGFWVALGMAVFTILFGTRNIDANEQHHGVVAAIALEALVKLVALIAVGLFVVFGVAGGIDQVFAMPSADRIIGDNSPFGPRWLALTFLSACAIVCLPRQFQVTVVENNDEDHLRTASWLFPLYLLLISLFILPIAIVGSSTLASGSNPDMFVLSLPMASGQNGLALLAFIGGFSSATSMIIVACIALSIMVSNHMVMPIVAQLSSHDRGSSGDYKRMLLLSRRISIIAILLLGFLYFVFSSRSDALAAIGLISFAGVAQFMPCLIGGLYWRDANKAGAIAGLLAGFFVWAYTLVLPSFASSGLVPTSVLTQGPWDIGLLKPEALFGMSGLDPLVHALFWSLSTNTSLFVLFSLLRDPKPLERIQGALFVDVYKSRSDDDSLVIHRSAAVNDLFVLAQRVLGADEALQLFRNFARQQNLTGNLPHPSAEFIAHLERRLAGVIGAASARVMVSQVASGETISMDELIKLVDETQQVIEYSHRLEEQSQELRDTAAQLREANLRLQRLDSQKDDFLSQISHELRTPMASIRSFSEILLETRNLDGEQAGRFLRIIHNETLRLTRLLDEILDLSHLERGQPNWVLQTIDGEGVLDQAVATCSGMAAELNIPILRQPPGPSCTVTVEPDRLAQVMINLISNAIKYNTSGDPWVRVGCHVENGQWHLLVQDNGPGIAPDNQPRIFEKFSRAWNEASPARSGTGLGLAISREIIRNLNGELELLPGAENGGARFRVTLPLASVEETVRQPAQ